MTDNAPVETGERYTVEIEELGEEGDGVGYVEDFAVLVSDAALGATVDVEIDEVGSNYALADPVNEHFEID